MQALGESEIARTAPSVTGGRAPRPLALAAALALASLVLVARGEGLLHGLPGVLTAVAGLLLIPVGHTWAERVVVVGMSYYGWLSASHWLAWPVPVERADVFLAGLVFAHVYRALPDPHALLALPRWTRADWLLPVGAVAAAVTQHRLLLADSPQEGLGSLLSGWDNAPHYRYIEQVRQFDLAQMYQIYDPFVAFSMSLAQPTTGDPAGAELVLAAQAQGWLVVSGMVVLTAAVAVLPGRSRTVVVPAVVSFLVGAMFIAGPGGSVLIEGFRNFWFACVATAVVIAVAVALRNGSFHAGLVLAASAGCVSVANSWLPMLAACLPPAVVMLARMISAWGALGRMDRTWSALAVAAGLTGVGRALWVLRNADASAYVVPTEGTIAVPNQDVLALVLAMGCCLSFLVLTSSSHLRSHAWLSSVAALGSVCLVLLGYLQSREGAVTYYFYKYGIGVELATVVTLLLVLVAEGDRIRFGRSTVRVLVATSTVVGVTAFVGSAVGWGEGPRSTSPSSLLQSHRLDDFPRSGGIAHQLISAAKLNSNRDERLVYLGFAGTRLQLPLGNQWFRAMTVPGHDLKGRWISPAWEVMQDSSRAADLAEASRAVSAVLEESPDTRVIVPPGVHDHLSTASSRYGHRLITWERR